VEPLPLEDAVRLFAARARAVAPSFRRPAEDADDVAQLCLRLDCLPLAIELSAARTRDYAPDELLASVPGSLALAGEGARDLPSRQRTLRATIEWSHRLLTPSEQALFTRLAVFAGGFTGASAGEVCGADRESLAALVAASLVQERAGPRGFMLETVREYALELLGEDAEVWRRRHAEHFAAVAEAVEGEHPASRSGAAWQDLEAEHDNFRAALDWSRDAGEVELQLRIVGALAYFWATSDHLREGGTRLDEALRHAVDAPAPIPLRANALAGIARVAHSLGDYERMRDAADACLELYRAIGDEPHTALALNFLGIALSNLGDIDGGIVCHEENAAISRRLGEGLRLSSALNNLGYCRLRRGQYDQARALFEDGLAVSREIGHRTGESVMLGNLGMAALLEGRPVDALAHLRSGLEIDRDLAYSEGVIYGVFGIAAALAGTDDAPEAAQLLGAADTAARAMAVELEPLELELHARVTAALQETLGRGGFADAHAAGQMLSLDDAVERALSAAHKQRVSTP
jgi:tetratricopeptide (TPR) repeat protein